jgi:hypothetical protein
MKRMTFTASAAVLLLAAVLFTAGPASAEEADMYVFGTKLVLTSPRQLMDPNSGWWADLLPTEYSYSIGSIVAAVNAAREARGVTEKIDVKTYPISIGGETPVSGGYEYNIDFARMTPADVDVVLAQFPLTGKLSDLPRDIRPIGIGYFYANTTEPNGTLALALAGSNVSIDAGHSFNTVHDMIAQVLQQRFGDRAKFDLSLNRYSSAMGTSSFDVNVTVYLDGAEQSPQYMPMESEGEGGM